MTRRTLLAMAAAGRGLRAASSYGDRAIRAVAFDAFAVFDPRPIAARVEQAFPGHGAELAALWRARQFEYTWLRTLMNSYTGFWTVTGDALVDAAKILKLDLSAGQSHSLMRGFLELRPWPEAANALRMMRDAGLRLVLLSNFTPGMLDAAVGGSGLDALFEARLSTDRVRAYKPDPRAYAMAEAAMKLPRDSIAFAAFAGWDAAGAAAFGFSTFWVRRMDAPVEHLGHAPDAIGANLDDLAAFVRTRSRLTFPPR